MLTLIEQELDYCLDSVNKRESLLFYSNRHHALMLMKGIYSNIKSKEEFLCSWHDASNINHQLDFLEPILKLKYNDSYDLMKEEFRFKEWYEKKNAGTFLNLDDNLDDLISLCAQEKDSNNLNARKLPVIFIDGIEELFFKMDYGHLNENSRKKLLSDSYADQPNHNGFGNCLRNLHQNDTAIFYGIVRNKRSIEYKTTLGNYNYLFYADNFKKYSYLY